MGKLKLTVNEEKTRICKVPEGEFDFLGFTHSLLEKLDPHCRWLTLGFGAHRFHDRDVMTEPRDDGCHYGVAIVAAAVR